jgi:ABC-type sugar transport system permease subunit
VLLVAFTHYPAVATLIDSFYSTPKGANPGVWVGLENYQVMVATRCSGRRPGTTCGSRWPRFPSRSRWRW